MNIRNLDFDTVDYIANMHLMSYIDIEFYADYSEKILQKQKKRIIKVCKDGLNEFPQEVQYYFKKSTPAKELFELIYNCHKVTLQEAERRKEEFFENNKGLSKDVLKALWDLSDFSIENYELENCTLRIAIDDTPSFKRTLVLKTDDTMPPYNPESSYAVSGLEKINNNYQLKFTQWVYDEQNEDSVETDFVIGFETATVEVECYRNVPFVYAITPWDLLMTYSNWLCEKYQSAPDFCNGKELELLPIAKELVTLSTLISVENKPLEYPLLTEYATKMGFPELGGLLEKALEKANEKRLKNKFWYWDISWLRVKMADVKYEPLWRDLFQKFQDSQSEYPLKADVVCEPQFINGIRKDIENQMHSKGYAGAYPNFEKTSDISLRTITKEDAENETLIGEKNVKHYVYCVETCDSDGINIVFYSGLDATKGRVCSDIYACMFNGKGRMFKTSNYSQAFEESDDICIFIPKHRLDIAVSIAVKKAEGMSLNKAERKQFGIEFSYSAPKFFIPLVAGGLWSVLFWTLMDPTLDPNFMSTTEFEFLFVGGWALFSLGVGVLMNLNWKK